MRTPEAISLQIRELQRAVANPEVSAWVAANAGSGKTHVLAQRVINLLLKGGQPAGEPKSIVFKEGNPDSQADRALAKLTQLAQYFDDESTPYRSLVHPMWRTHYGDYDHLARVKEWSSSGGVTDDLIGGE